MLLCVSLLGIACGDDVTPSADAAPDTAPPVQDATLDSTLPDADVPVPEPEHCDPCRRDRDCQDGALCLVLEGGERGCGHPCTSDADCAEVGGECREELSGLPFQCTPTEGTCTVSPPGSSCPASGCTGRYDRCVDPEGFGPICTNDCRVDADCPLGMRRCRQTVHGRICVPDEGSTTSRCDHLLTSLGLTPCAAERSCAAGSRCYGGGTRARCLPEPSGGECPRDTALASTIDGDVCVPHLGRIEPDGYGGLDCACLLAEAGSLFDDVIGAQEMDRCSLSFDGALAMVDPTISQDRFRFSWTDRLHNHWPSTRTFSQRLSSELDEAMRSDQPLSQALTLAGRYGDLRGPDARAPGVGSLSEEITEWIRDTGGEPVPDEIERQLSTITDEALAAAIARIVSALRTAHQLREQALERIEGERDRYFEGTVIIAGLPFLNPRRTANIGALLGDVDVARLHAASVQLATAIESANLARFTGASAAVDLDSPAGRIVLRGGETNDTYESSWAPTALLIDLGGDDIYRFAAGATTSAAHGVAVTIDVAGNDEYGYPRRPSPGDVGPEGHARLPADEGGRAPGAHPASRSTVGRQGSGRLGVGLLVDISGDDEYRSLRMSQGFGQLGVGALWDQSGNDLYHAEHSSQGSAAFGLGLHLDGGGADRYISYSFSQGFGYVRGVGIAASLGGDDSYLLHPSDVLYPSAQDPSGSNSSMGQGAGFGRRTTFPSSGGDGVFMSGGLGVLRDQGGDDQYQCAIFCSGAGYWYGTGVLADGDGADRYNAQWYGLGGSAHFAVAAFLDAAGPDQYNQEGRRQNVILGCGHDFSTSWAEDMGGDDIYAAPSLAFGVGNDGGSGFFLDRAGDDQYESHADSTFGFARAPRDDAFRIRSGTFGFFMEAGGEDRYSRPTVEPLSDDGEWTQGDRATFGERGAGIDRDAVRIGI